MLLNKIAASTTLLYMVADCTTEQLFKNAVYTLCHWMVTNHTTPAHMTGNGSVLPFQVKTTDESTSSTQNYGSTGTWQYGIYFNKRKTLLTITVTIMASSRCVQWLVCWCLHVKPDSCWCGQSMLDTLSAMMSFEMHVPHMCYDEHCPT